MIRWLLVITLFATPAMAMDPEYQWILDDLRTCYEATDTFDGKHACEGVILEPCQNALEGGWSNLGTTRCIQFEGEAWDVLLNEEYRNTMEWLAKLDNDDMKYYPEYAIRVDILRDAQRAWIAYRDAVCRSAYSIWGAGSMRLPIGAACVATETAERTIELWTIRGSY